MTGETHRVHSEEFADGSGLFDILSRPGRTAVRGLARLYPWEVDVSEELDRAMDFLDWEVAPEAVVRAGFGAGFLVTGLAMMCLVFVPSRFLIVFALLALSLGIGTIHAVHTIPHLAVTARRTSALGAAPDLVSRAVLSMRLAPTPERAAVFAAETDEGVLASELERHVRQAKLTGQSGLASFADDWADLFPSLRRSFALVEAAGQTPSADRRELLDRALTVVLDGTRDNMQEYANAIRSPTTALYAFGVLLPMALVALLPAGSAADLSVTPLTVVLLYNVVLPAILLVASIRLLARRPMAFPPPNVGSDHPDVDDQRWLALACGLGAGVAAWFICAMVFPWWGPPLAAIGIGGGVALCLHYRPVIEVYERIREVEGGLSDALALVGRRVANGHAVEAAIEASADELDGEMGTVLATGARRQRQLQIGVRQAFFGKHGVLETIPSARVRGSMALVSHASAEGRPAGGALLALAEHVDDLQDIQKEARYSLAHVCRTLKSTATVFGPMVAGATVALAGSMSGQEGLPGGEQSLTWLGGPIGVYVLILVVLLTALSVGLTRGLDRSLLGYRIGVTSISATITYLCTYLVVGVIA